MNEIHALLSENGSRKVLQFRRFPISAAPYPRHSFDCHVAFEITHFVGAEGVYIIEDTEYEIKSGDIFIIRSNEKHQIHVTKPGYLENLFIEPSFVWQGGSSFDLNFLNIFHAENGHFQNRLDRNNPACETIRDLYTAILKEFKEQKYGYAQMIRMHCNMVLLTLIREFRYCNGDASTMHIPQVEAIHKTMQYIEDHLTEPLSIQFLADIANLSPNYYGTRFKEINGMTPGEYITSKRILHAISLLPDFKGTMLELALSCGFNNTANFNRAFRAYTGQVPSRYVPPII